MRLSLIPTAELGLASGNSMTTCGKVLRPTSRVLSQSTKQVADWPLESVDPFCEIRRTGLGVGQGSLRAALALPKSVREVAILVTGAHFRSAYESRRGTGGRIR